MLTPFMMALLACYWLLHRDERAKLVADVLALNWVLNQAAVMFRVEDIGPLPVFLVTDFLAGAYLGLYVGGALARAVGYWYVPMIALNTAMWAADQGEPMWHYYTLLLLAYLQVMTGMTKVWGHGLLATVDTAVRGIRFKSAGAAFLVGRFFR